MIITQDGSTTLYSETFKDHYHSTYGAINESMHIFIQSGLLHLLTEGYKRISILEVGLGTGLNALLTCLEKKEIQVDYTALEPFPLNHEIIQLLNYDKEIKNQHAGTVLKNIHETAWEEFTEIQNGFNLKKVSSKIQDYSAGGGFDLIYFDAFSPASQPEIWQQEIFKKIYQLCNANAALVTYCCKGDVRRALNASGFNVEKIPGPIGKREIIRARKNNSTL